MTFAELVDDLATRLDSVILDGDAAQTMVKALDGKHPNALAGAALKAIAMRTGCESATSRIERASAVNALGPLRLQYMRDDAPVEGFRFIERMVQAIDAAFNEEALRAKNEPGRSSRSSREP